MGNVAASVTIITTFDQLSRPTGLTVSAFSSVSLDPQLVSVCIGKESSSLSAIREWGGFTVNFLAAGTGDLAMAMASKSEDKFINVDYDPPSSEVAGPVLRSAVFSYFECEIESDIEAGDHVIFIGRVVGGEFVEEREPLIYWRRGFAGMDQ